MNDTPVVDCLKVSCLLSNTAWTFGLACKQRIRQKVFCYSESAAWLAAPEKKLILILDNIGFFSGVWSCTYKIGWKCQKTTLFFHQNSTFILHKCLTWVWQLPEKQKSCAIWDWQLEFGLALVKLEKKIPKNNTFLPTKSPLSSCIYAWLLVWHLPEEPEVFASLDWQLPLESGTCQKILKPFFTQDWQLKMCQEMGGGVRLNSAFLYWVLMFL